MRVLGGGERVKIRENPVERPTFQRHSASFASSGRASCTMSSNVTVRTRKFIRNALLARRQMVSNVSWQAGIVSAVWWAFEDQQLMGGGKGRCCQGDQAAPFLAALRLCKMTRQAVAIVILLTRTRCLVRSTTAILGRLSSGSLRCRGSGVCV